MRVLIMFTQPWHHGGAETHLETLVRGLLARSIKVVLIGIDDAIARHFSDIPVYVLPLRTGNPRVHLQNYVTMGKILIKHGIQLIHAHHRTGTVYAYLLRLRLGVPYVVTFHDKWRPVHRIYRFFLPPHCIAISNGIKQHFQNVFKLKGQALQVVANGVDVGDFRIGETQERADEYTLLFASRFNHHKVSIPLLLCQTVEHLHACFPGIRLLLAGDGPNAEEVAAAAGRTNAVCGREIVTCLGFRNDIARLLANADIAVGAGRFALEAMAAGKPVIAIADGTDYPGIITPENWLAASMTSWTRGGKAINADNLQGDIERLLGDKSLRQELGQFNRRLIAAEFSAEKMTSGVVEIYQRTWADGGK